MVRDAVSVEKSVIDIISESPRKSLEGEVPEVVVKCTSLGIVLVVGLCVVVVVPLEFDGSRGLKRFEEIGCWEFFVEETFSNSVNIGRLRSRVGFLFVF